MMQGQFIVVEGIDGAGTTTIAGRLVEVLKAQKRPVIVTREPSWGPVGALIRQILAQRVVVPGSFGPRSPGFATMALLFAADRVDHLEAEVEPYLHDGMTVVCDRYDLSSVAYQSATADADDPARGAEITEWIRTLNQRARRPDLTVVLDVPAEIAAERRRARSFGRDDLYEHLDLQKKLAALYARAEELLPGDKIVHIDANRPVDDVLADVVRAVREL
jgi:dTMP kinase